MRHALIAVLVLLSVAAARATETGNSMPAAEPAAVEAPAAAPSGMVARAQFTSDVQNREPTDSITNLSNDNTRILFFTELKGFAGSRVTHRWEFNGAVMHELAFEVGADRWRVWSSKTLDPLWLGEWKVSVVDANGAVVAVNSFTYVASASVPAMTPATP